MKMVTLKHFLFMSCLALLTDATYGGAQIYIRRQPEASRNISVNVGGALNGSICIDCQNQIQAQETDQKQIDKEERQVKLPSNLIENEIRIPDVNTTTTIKEESYIVTEGKSTVKPELPKLKITKEPELPNLGTTLEVDLPILDSTKEPLPNTDILTKDGGLTKINLRLIPQAFKAKLSKANVVRVTPKAKAPAASEALADAEEAAALRALKAPATLADQEEAAALRALKAPATLADTEEAAALKALKAPATLADPEEAAALKAPATLADQEEAAALRALKAPATLADQEEAAALKALKAPANLADPEEAAASKLAQAS
ncbi:testis-specific gene A8 protein isoform X2 [Drosophila grimshawi]|uniref:testis-specific gene A8 protein isoform X2 n=1 Tax=Drosophila grimshawi TaxID=7222 RepID=UPI000C86EFEA|nr:testis-specific gene A8 protein isoform X2 [Drosophila grimshawi]